MARSARKAKRVEQRRVRRKLFRAVRADLAGLKDGGGQGHRPLHFSRGSSPWPGKGAEEMMYKMPEVHQLPQRTAGAKLEHGGIMKIASFNVRSIRRPTVHHQLAAYMRESGISVLALQETKVSKISQYVVDDCLFVLHGRDSEEREHGGVGLAFSPQARRMITGFEFRPGGAHSDRGVGHRPPQTVDRYGLCATRRPPRGRTSDLL